MVVQVQQVIKMQLLTQEGDITKVDVRTDVVVGEVQGIIQIQMHILHTVRAET